MQLTNQIEIAQETHVVIPLDNAPAGEDITFLSIIALNIVCVKHDQWLIWPFPNPDHQYNAYQYKILRPDQAAHIPKTLALINKVFQTQAKTTGVTTTGHSSLIVASWEELVLKLPFETIVELYPETDATLFKQYKTNYAFALLHIKATDRPQDVHWGWRWKGPAPFICCTWLGPMPSPMILCIFNTQRLQWQQAQYNDPGPPVQETCTDKALLQTLIAVDGKTAALQNAVYTKITKYRSTDIIATPHVQPFSSLSVTKPKEPCVIS